MNVVYYKIAAILVYFAKLLNPQKSYYYYKLFLAS